MELNFNAIYNSLSLNQIDFKYKNATIGTIVTDLLPFIFVLAGILLLLFLIMGGLQMMVSAGNPKSSEAAKGKVTGALVGFIIVFISYWLVKILVLVFKMNTGVI